MLSVTAGACAAAGAPGPGTRIRGKPARDFGGGPWLGLLDFEGFRRGERDVLLPWLRERAEPLLLVRHLLLGKPLGEDVYVELTPRALEAMPEGFRDAARPILILAPAGRSRAGRRKQYLDALSRLRIPLVSAGSSLWAIREFDPDFLVAIAQLWADSERANFRSAIDPSQTRLFDQQFPAAEAAVLDDLVGARDDDSEEVALDLESVCALNPGAHPLAVFAAVERTRNRRKGPEERTQFSARTIEARLSAHAFPDDVPACTADFEDRASAIVPLLPAELQRVFEASELLARG
jgi:hypothetical protein